SNAVSYWNIYDNNKVTRYTNKGGNISLIGEYRNVSGLPVHYHNQSEQDDNYGRSDLEDIVSLIDTMEDILSKLVDSYHKFHTPIPVITGQQITDGALSKDIAGTGLTLEDNSTFSLVTSKLDYQSFQTIWKTLMQSMLDVSGTPSVSMNQGTTANLAEVSIKMLYTLADMRAAQNEIYFRDGLYDRFNKIKRMLEYLDVKFDEEEYDTLDVVFQYARPLNETDVINNLKALSEIGGISLKSLLERNPYIVDVVQELERLKGSNRNKDDTVNERMKDNLTENGSNVIENV
ncbi:phage portal protein, partial [Bacillus sp. JJ1503]|uniref:phage portal protein n=1 Tax=Bacillus sp. JJ1503 TaxID=3122956 RepID=UPI002FFFC884